MLEALEKRVLLAITQVDIPDFSSTTGLTGNGFGAAAITSGNRLRMTSGGTHTARTVWFNDPVPIETFTTSFSFQSVAAPDSADGFTFTIQNGPATALGNEGFDLGYKGIANSEAIAFNLYNFHNFGSQFGFASNGEHPSTDTDMSPIDLHSGRVFNATVSYDGTDLDVVVTDASDASKTFNASKTIDLPDAIGSDAAIVGFTASTGASVATQDVLSWTFSGESDGNGGNGQSAPTIMTPASASPSPVPDNTTTLTVLGDDTAGEGDLTYTWSVAHKPPGAKDPIFSANGTNDSKTCTATFFKDGTYRFRVTVTNSSGESVTGEASVVVLQKASLFRISPHKAQIPLGTTLDYDATVLDQFNHKMRTPQDIEFSLQSGQGTIDPLSGLFTAPSQTRGHIDITATSGDLTGTVGGTVVG